MRVWISNYRNTWLSPYTILEKAFFWREIDYDEPMIKRWNKILTPFCNVLQKVRQFVYPRWEYIKIERWDTWSMDHTLAHIILPMLKQLQDTKHGAPNVDDEDAPEYLRSYMAQPKEYEWDIDSLHFLRWDWVLDEMIWAFEQKLKDDDESEFFDHSAYADNEDDEVDHNAWLNDMSEGKSKLKVDWDGLKAHQERKQNGYRLFGKYYQNLWD